MGYNPIVPRASTMSNLSQTAATPDYSTWLTKQQAAEALDVTTKTVERMAQDGQLQQGRRRGATSGQKIAVYHPDDVARIASARRTAPAPFVLPAVSASPANGNGQHPGTALAIPPPSAIGSGEELLHAFAAALGRMSQTSETSAYVAKPEALAIAGISADELRKAVTAGEVKMRGRRYRVEDLKAL